MGRCSSCGFKSRRAAAFRYEATPGLGGEWRYCQVCGPTPLTVTERAQIKEEIRSIVIAGGLAILFVFFSRAPSLLVYAALVVCAPFVLAVHELGHAVAARLVGYEAVWIQYGFGPVRWRWRMLGFGIQVRRFAWGAGMTHMHRPDLAGWRLREALVDVAGSAVNIAFGIAFFMLGARLDAGPETPELAVSVCAALGIANIVTGLFNLIPSGGDGELSSDGRNLLKALFGKAEPIKPEVRALYRTLQHMNAREPVALIVAAKEGLKAYPDELYHLNCAYHGISQVEGDAAALAFASPYRQRVDFPADRLDERTRESQAWTRVNLAWSGIKLGLSNEAWVGRYAQDALAVAPYPAMQMTAGAWMIDTGRAPEGRPLMTEGVRQLGELAEKAEACRFLAMAARAAGEMETADDYEAIGRHLRSVTRRAA
jgi:Zn-dependent protease